MKAREINRHFLERAPWGDPDKTVDRVICGDPEKEVKSILVTWMSNYEALHYAQDNGFDMVMTHEPTFYVHAKETATMDEKLRPEMLETAKEKLRFIESSGLVVLRNHDVWDLFPGCGIPFALAEYLGFGRLPAAVSDDRYHHRYDIEPTTAGELARRVAEKAALLGEAAAVLFGDPDKTVSRIGVGTGCGCHAAVYKSLGCDAGLVCDDGFIYWGGISWTKDAGFPVVRLNHATTEEPGMVSLTAYINQNLPGVKASYFKHDKQMHIYGKDGREV